MGMQELVKIKRELEKSFMMTGLEYTTPKHKDHPENGLDFYLPVFDLHIEVCMTADNATDKANRFENVLICKGVRSVAFVKSTIDMLWKARENIRTLSMVGQQK